MTNRTLMTILILVPLAFFAGAVGATMVTIFFRERAEQAYWEMVILFAIAFLLLVLAVMGPYPLGGE